MPELSERVGVSESALDALETIRDGHDEFDNFFGEVFDQLQSLSLELFARHKCQELSSQHQEERTAATAEHQQQCQQLLKELQRLRGEVASLRGSTAELNEALAEQRREAAGHQAALVGELKRVCSLVEAISKPR